MNKFFSWLVTYWYLVLPLLLGLVSLVALLPSASRKKIPLQAGLAAGVLSLLLAGLLILNRTGNFPLDLFFYFFSGVAVAAAGAMIVQRNPVYSALYFAIVILGVCGLFLVMSASFLAAVTIIVYAGAIIVTFLFVIMLAQQTGLADYDRRSRERIFSCLAGFVLLTAILFVIEKNFSVETDPKVVVAALKEAQDVTAADRYVRSSQEIMDLLKVNGKSVESQMNSLFSQLSAWPQVNENKAAAAQAWKDANTLLQDNQVSKTHSSLSKLYAIALSMEEALQRHQGVLSSSKAGATNQAFLSQNRMEKNNDHVNELGRSLFGDYLYAVELAGTLLLVATIAAIVIAQESGRPSLSPRKKVAA